MANSHGHGGKRIGAGRPKGSHAKSTKIDRVNLSISAREHTLEAIDTLVDIMRNGISDGARMAAALALLDRGHGRPGPKTMEQPIDDLTTQLLEVFRQDAKPPPSVSLDDN